MEMGHMNERKRPFEIRTFERGGNEVSVSPERGGIVTSLRLSGRELLFMNPETFQNPEKNVRGGIPILFPFSGPSTDGIRDRFPGLDTQHGFARTSKTWKIEALPNGFRETLESDGMTKEAYPYDFRLSVSTELGDDGSVTIVQEVGNTGNETMPVSMGLHPYLRVPRDLRRDIGFDFEGGEKISEEFENWTRGGTTDIDNPGILRISIPGLGTLVMEVSPEYRHILVWSEGPDSDYICIEPVMRLDGGLADDPENVGPGAVFSGKVTYRLESEE
ncbi:MAG: hypothetical protein HGA31_05460 [Candidatus Moranbacteria bacterium]|nr:hypothetical protein [Candidatus Moranbacteria bacterium]